MIKTSLTHPLRIESVVTPSGRGRIGMTLCPGKKGRSTFGGTWDRDLATDLKAIKDWGAAALVSLMEDHEFTFLKVESLPDRATALGLRWFHLPITDVSIPDERFLNGWKIVGPKLRAILQNDGSIVLHCRGGLGRTGLVAAQILIELGMDPKEAIRMVREARPGTIETQKQEAYVLEAVALQKAELN